MKTKNHRFSSDSSMHSCTTYASLLYYRFSLYSYLNSQIKLFKFLLSYLIRMCVFQYNRIFELWPHVNYIRKFFLPHLLNPRYLCMCAYPCTFLLFSLDYIELTIILGQITKTVINLSQIKIMFYCMWVSVYLWHGTFIHSKLCSLKWLAVEEHGFKLILEIWMSLVHKKSYHLSILGNFLRLWPNLHYCYIFK